MCTTAGVAEPSEPEAEVERGADDNDEIGVGLQQASGCG